MYTRALREYVRFLGDRIATKSTHVDVQEFLAFLNPDTETQFWRVQSLDVELASQSCSLLSKACLVLTRRPYCSLDCRKFYESENFISNQIRGIDE